MHPLVEDVHRADPIPMCVTATRTTAIGSARHLVEMAALRTRLGRVRLANFDQLDAVRRPQILTCDFGLRALDMRANRIVPLAVLVFGAFDVERGHLRIFYHDSRCVGAGIQGRLNL